MERMPRTWQTGFFLLGIVLGLLASIVIAWQYHIDVDPELIGLHFLALNAGYVSATIAAQLLLKGWTPRSVALLSGALCVFSLTGLMLAFPPAWVGWRLLLLGLLGASGGSLSPSLFQALDNLFFRLPATALHQAGVATASGCLLATLTTLVCYSTPAIQFETGFLALIPVGFCLALLAGKGELGRSTPPTVKDDVRLEKLRDLRSIATFLVSLLLFFQFASEWGLAGWLSLFVVHRLGGNPIWAMLILAAYFLALVLGRLAVRRLPVHKQDWRLPAASTALTVGGCLALCSTSSALEILLSVAVIGFSQAPVYLFAFRCLRTRIPFRAGFYTRTMSIAITGGMSAAWLLGYVDANLGMKYVMLLPAVGSIAVLILALLLRFESHLMGGEPAIEERQPPAVERFRVAP